MTFKIKCLKCNENGKGEKTKNKEKKKRKSFISNKTICRQHENQINVRVPLPIVAQYSTCYHGCVTLDLFRMILTNDFDTGLTLLCSLNYFQVTIGDRGYGHIGTVLLQANVPELTSKSIMKQTSGATVYVVASIAVVVFIITVVLVVLALYFRNTRKKEESYSAHYNRDNILTLDGLSGSHASDAIQTRQNSKFRSSSWEEGILQNVMMLLLWQMLNWIKASVEFLQEWYSIM